MGRQRISGTPEPAKSGSCAATTPQRPAGQQPNDGRFPKTHGQANDATERPGSDKDDDAPSSFSAETPDEAVRRCELMGLRGVSMASLGAVHRTLAVYATIVPRLRSLKALADSASPDDSKGGM
jgi:hypothetical protein